MKYTKAIIIIYGLIMFIPAHCFSKEIHLWFIPMHFENSDYLTGLTETEMQAMWLKEYGADSQVRCENLLNPMLKDQLVYNRGELGEPHWQRLFSQISLMKALKRFAQKNDHIVSVRFIMWGKLFSELQKAIHTNGMPDVFQVGSTWVKYFSDQGLLLTQHNSKHLNFRSLPNIHNISVRFTTDMRMLFYWKKLPDWPASDQNIHLKTDSWDTLIASLTSEIIEGNNCPPMVMPVGLTVNLIHDLVALVSDPTNSFYNENSRQVRLTGPSINLPLLLAEKSTINDANGFPRRVIAFPEITMERAGENFCKGKYLATIQPAEFISQWFESFKQFSQKNGLKKVLFWDYAGIELPPHIFKGGSDLVVYKHSINKDAALQLREFLATDPEVNHCYIEVEKHFERFLSKLPEGYENFQKKVEKGLESNRIVNYPHLSKWPTHIETRDILEKCQVFWRRIAEGDRLAIIHSAEELENEINEIINFKIHIINIIKSWWYVILFVLMSISFENYRFSEDFTWRSDGNNPEVFVWKQPYL